MNKNYFFTLVTLFTIVNINAQTIWNGTKKTFTKQDSADFNLAVNQDQITDNVHLTRGNDGGGIFNIVSETSYSRASSPADTEWAEGTTANINSLTFSNFHALKPQNIAGKNLVLHLVSENIYIDIKFNSWSSSKKGGFSYERSTNNSLSNENIKIDNNVKIYQNIIDKAIYVNGLIKNESYKIYSISGAEVKNGIANNNRKISTNKLTTGIYIFKLASGKSLQFFKN